MNTTTFTLGVAAGVWLAAAVVAFAARRADRRIRRQLDADIARTCNLLADDTRLPAHIRASFAQHPSVVAARTDQLRADIDEWERGER